MQFDIVEADYAGFRSLSATLSLAMALAVAAGTKTERQELSTTSFRRAVHGEIPRPL